MSKYESRLEDLSFRRSFFWYFIPGVKFEFDRSTSFDEISFVDWMEQNVGRFGYDWDWGLYCKFPGDHVYLVRCVVKLRRKKKHYQSLILLRWT